MSPRNGTRSENTGVCAPLPRITAATASGTAQALHLHGQSGRDQRVWASMRICRYADCW
ncbi:hypothetical protein [Kitasatospora griseola]|uniref:hypothetical protein n=1 Tax=Kitasatospora griseola TaxID=2064 RepID=UPI001670E39C|nr:hypothetical protein [Kitasatospora griseola]